jgi:predicted amidohydrolase YtcJ
VVDDHDLPGLDELATSIAAAHHRGRPVAVHAVTRAALLLALAAWDEAGPHAGDRLEHGAVVPPGQAARLAALGITVVTQPAFVRDRGDDYLVEVEADDVAHLWPCRSLADAGVGIGGSSDAPFGHPDPWRAMSAATTRRTLGGRMLGLEERIGPEAALRLYLAPLDDPGGPPRTLQPGGDADLVLLGVPLVEALANPCADVVVTTVCQGRLRQS